MPERISGEYVGCVAGEVRLAVPVEDVQEVFETTTVTRVPHAPDKVMGMINMRGNVVPVLNILGARTASKEARRVVVLKSPWGLVGVLITQLVELVRFETDEPVVSLPEPLQGFAAGISGTGVYEGETYYMMDAERVVAATLPQETNQGSVE